MSSKLIFSLLVIFTIFHTVISDCTDFKYGRCNLKEEAFETATFVDLQECQEWVCGHGYEEKCKTFVYERKSRICYLFNETVEVEVECLIHSGVPQDNRTSCPANECDVFTEFECIYDGDITEVFSGLDEARCKDLCHKHPYYVHYAIDGGKCECRNSKQTQECDYLRGPQKPSFTTNCDSWVHLHGRDFYFNASIATFEDAQASCMSHGGKLFEPKNSTVNMDITKLAKINGMHDFWIGINDKSQEGNFVYASDGTSVTWNNWCCNGPDNYGGNQNCVQIGYGEYYYGENYSWDDEPCDRHFSFVCERS